MSIRSGIQAFARGKFPGLYGQIKLFAAARDLTKTGSAWSINCLEDESLRTIIRGALRRGGTGIDIGASVGDFTAVMSGVSPMQTHHAFEANPAVAEKLTHRFRGKNVVVHAEALSAESGTTCLYVPPSNTGTGGLRITPAASKEGAISEINVPVKMLDDYLDNIGDCRIIKLDIEGAELLALRGGKRLLMRDRPLVYFECVTHIDIYGYDAGAVFEFFAAFNYEIYDPFSYLGGLAPLDKKCFADRVFSRRNYNFVATSSSAKQEVR